MTVAHTLNHNAVVAVGKMARVEGVYLYTFKSQRYVSGFVGVPCGLRGLSYINEARASAWGRRFEGEPGPASGLAACRWKDDPHATVRFCRFGGGQL